MPKSQSHPKTHSKSKIIRNRVRPVPIAPMENAAQKPPAPAAPAFSAANASLQNASDAAIGAPQIVTPEVIREPEIVAPVAPSPPVAMPVQGVLPREVVREAGANRGATLPSKSKTKPRVNRDNRARPGVWLGAGAGALLLVAGGAAAGAYSKFAASEVIAPNVSIGGVPVGGLSADEATARVRSHFKTPRIVLLCDDTKVSVPFDQLGAKLSVEPTVKKALLIGRDGFLPNNLMRVYGGGAESKRFMLPIEWDKAKLADGLQKVNDHVAVQPVNARLRAASVGLEVVPDRAGRALDTQAAAQLLQHKLFVGLGSLHVPSKQVEAKISARSLDGHDVQLAQYTTRFNAGLAGRTENIRIACRAIQNRVLMPGDTFSFNACTGERTARKGYQMAHIFLREPGADEPEVVEGLAGGVCQVSSTLFNAIRKTNADADTKTIKIVERNTHSLPVTYVPPGLDATVAWPYKDLKFKNVTDHPVYLRTQMGRSKLSISIWGRIPRESV